MRQTITLLTISAMLMCVSLVPAASIWDGGGADDNWTTAANWGAAGSDGVPGTGSTATDNTMIPIAPSH